MKLYNGSGITLQVFSKGGVVQLNPGQISNIDVLDENTIDPRLTKIAEKNPPKK